jgi:glycosylphosphatidylinositol deacylase
MGHSMGGIVATSLLPSSDISAIITMSTPHTLPPARFDSRIDKIYARNEHILQTDATPILSLCGGATDMMIPSESCILPAVRNNTIKEIFRRTIFTSALEGSWTGVGHREMVWCHQVRWRVARAALELGEAWSTRDQADVLERWLRDANSLSHVAPAAPNDLTLFESATYEVLPADIHLVLKKPMGSQTYLLPIPLSPPSSLSKFILFVSQGSVPPVSPQHPNTLHASVHLCRQTNSEPLTATNSHGHSIPPSCTILSPDTLKLVPNPMPGKPFPVSDEGSDESEGVVVFEANVQSSDSYGMWVAVHIQNAYGAGWVVGGFTPSDDSGGVMISDMNSIGLFFLQSSRAFALSNYRVLLVPFFGKVPVKLPVSNGSIPLRTKIQIPNLLSNALIVYRLTPSADFSSSTRSKSTCAGSFIFTALTNRWEYTNSRVVL